MLVDVLTEQGIVLAKVLNQTESVYTIQYFLEKKNDQFIYNDCIENVDIECINAQYDDGEEEKSEGYELYMEDEDSEYEPSDSDSESDDESLVNSDEDVSTDEE
jgi:hypothetical protein